MSEKKEILIVIKDGKMDMRHIGLSVIEVIGLLRFYEQAASINALRSGQGEKTDGYVNSAIV